MFLPRLYTQVQSMLQLGTNSLVKQSLALHVITNIAAGLPGTFSVLGGEDCSIKKKMAKARCALLTFMGGEVLIYKSLQYAFRLLPIFPPFFQSPRNILG